MLFVVHCFCFRSRPFEIEEPVRNSYSSLTCSLERHQEILWDALGQKAIDFEIEIRGQILKD